MPSQTPNGWVQPSHRDLKSLHQQSSRFGTAGLFRPIPLIMEVAVGDSWIKEGHVLTAEATIFHERTHWWHYIGTSYGIFCAFLTEYQFRAAAIHLAKQDVIPRETFPLLGLEDVQSDHSLSVWRALEYLHYSLSGDLSKEKLEFLRSGEIDLEGIFLYFQALCDNYVKGADPSIVFPKLSDYSRAQLPDHIVLDQFERGATYLLEDAGRINEFLCLNTRSKDPIQGYASSNVYNKIHGTLGQLNMPLDMIDALSSEGSEAKPREIRQFLASDRFFSEPYGFFRSKFYAETGLDQSHFADAVFLTAVDCALNPPLPPLVTSFNAFGSDTVLLHPVSRFEQLTQLACDFKFAHKLNPTHSDVFHVAQEFLDFVGARQPSLSTNTLLKSARGNLHRLRALARGGVTRSPAYDRRAFLGLKAAEAMKIRKVNRWPFHSKNKHLFFALPFDIFCNDRDEFESIARKLECPLSMQGSRLEGDDPRSKEFEFFAGCAIAHEVARAAMYCSVEELQEIIRRYLNIYPWPRHESFAQVMVMPIANLLGDIHLHDSGDRGEGVSLSYSLSREEGGSVMIANDDGIFSENANEEEQKQTQRRFDFWKDTEMSLGSPIANGQCNSSSLRNIYEQVIGGISNIGWYTSFSAIHWRLKAFEALGGSVFPVDANASDYRGIGFLAEIVESGEFFNDSIGADASTIHIDARRIYDQDHLSQHSSSAIVEQLSNVFCGFQGCVVISTYQIKVWEFADVVNVPPAFFYLLSVFRNKLLAGNTIVVPSSIKYNPDPDDDGIRVFIVDRLKSMSSTVYEINDAWEGDADGSSRSRTVSPLLLVPVVSQGDFFREMKGLQFLSALYSELCKCLSELVDALVDATVDRRLDVLLDRYCASSLAVAAKLRDLVSKCRSLDIELTVSQIGFFIELENTELAEKCATRFAVGENYQSMVGKTGDECSPDCFFVIGKPEVEPWKQSNLGSRIF